MAIVIIIIIERPKIRFQYCLFVRCCNSFSFEGLGCESEEMGKIGFNLSRGENTLEGHAGGLSSMCIVQVVIFPVEDDSVCHAVGY